MNLSKRAGIGFPFAATGRAALVLCALALMSAMFTAGVVSISSSANLGAADVTHLLAINTGSAANTALIDVRLGKILQEAEALSGDGDLVLMNYGTLSLLGTVTLGTGNFAFTTGILELGNSNFTRALGAGVGQVNMNSASDAVDSAALDTERVVNPKGSDATVTWNAGNVTRSSGSIIGTGIGILTALTYAIERGTASQILPDTGSTMTTPTGGVDALTAVKTWSGLSLIDSNWSRDGAVGNWTLAAAPVAGDSLFFGGILRLTNTNDLTADTSFAGITFNSLAGAFTLGGNRITLGGDVTNNSTTLQTINLAMILSGNRTFTTVTGGGNLTIGGVLSETGGAQGIIKAGAGTLTLSGANTYTGATTVSAGILKAGVASVANTSGAFGNNSAVTLANISGVTLDITGFNTQIGSLTGGGTTGGNVTLGAAILTMGGDNTSPAAYAGVISGIGGVTKIGTGTQTFSGANAYTGATTITAGVLSVQNDTGLGTTAAGTTVSNGATLQLQGDITVGSEALNIRGTGASGQTGALVNVSGTNNYGGLLTLAGATTLSSSSGTLNLTHAGTITGATFGLTLTGAGNGSISSIIGTTSGSLTNSGTGTWTLSGVNTYTGATTVNGGTLTLASGSGSALGFTSGITVNSGGTLLLGASNQINNTATITLGGGTFAKGNFSEGSASTAGVGALVLSAAGSHLDFGTGTVGDLTFASFAPGSNILTIDNWTGTFGTVGTDGLTDRLIFASDQSGNLGSFNFTGFGPGALEFDLGGGYWEITPVPEAGTYFSGSIVLLLILFHHRKQLRQLVQRWRASRKLRFSTVHGTGVAS